MISRVVVIVLSFNGAKDTLACLESLKQVDNYAFDILVVDNGSSDGSAALIRAHHPDVALIELTENRGWAGGNNVGIEYALARGAEMICLLNNDTIVPPGAIGALANAAWRHTPCLMHPIINFADPMEGPQLDPTRSVSMGPFSPLGPKGDLFALDFAYGACLMFSADIFRRIGPFDERFFLQLEETDFWLRARRIGIRSLCTTAATIIHAESRSFGGRTKPLKTYYIVRNTLLLTEKHCRNPADVFRALRSLYWSVLRVAQTDSSASGRIPLLAWAVSRNPFLVAARAGIQDYVMRRFGKISETRLRTINQ